MDKITSEPEKKLILNSEKRSDILSLAYFVHISVHIRAENKIHRKHILSLLHLRIKTSNARVGSVKNHNVNKAYPLITVIDSFLIQN